MRDFLGKVLGAVRAFLSAWSFGDQQRVTDDKGAWDSLLVAGGGPEDRPWHAVAADLGDAREAWRKNFLIRQIVRLTTAYVVGDGIQVSSVHPRVGPFVAAFWTHRQNKIANRLAAWCDELTRSGELFIALFPNPIDGMSYVRAVPASQIYQVETDREDYEKETAYLERVVGQLDPKRWASVWTAQPGQPVLLHFTVNKPVGATRGESDLSPVLPWASRYTEWLKDRVRLNKLRCELAVAEIVVSDDSQVGAKQEQYRANPPTAGSIYVHGKGEELKYPAANIAAAEVADDGKSLRLAVAAGANVPLHFLAEGSSATRSTAEEMGDPTHRHYRMRQRDFCGILAELCEQAYRIRCLMLDYWLPMGEEFKIVTSAPDISRADNGALASAAAGIVGAFATMKQNGWIDDETAIRLSFQFAGEIVSDEEIEKILQEAKDGRGLTGEQGSPSGGAGRGTAVEADSVYSVKTGRPIWYD